MSFYVELENDLFIPSNISNKFFSILRKEASSSINGVHVTAHDPMKKKKKKQKLSKQNIKKQI